MDVALSAAQWVVGQALAPITDSVLEAWLASKNLGANVGALKTELLYVKATFETASGKQLGDRKALKELLQKMRDWAQKAENLLDELDYFRIHDNLNGTFDAADENPKGRGHDLVQTARHTAKAVGKLLACATPGNRREEDAPHRVPCCPQLRARRRALGGSSSTPSTSKLGNLSPCSSFPYVRDDKGNSAKPIRSNNDEEKHCLQFRRVEVSKSLKQIADELGPLRKQVSKILHDCKPCVAREPPMTTHDITDPKLYGRDVIVNSIINDITKGKYHANGLTVIPIVGVGGIGKTTMTRHIYHNKEVEKHFDHKIWLCVSLNFDANKLLEEIKEKTRKFQGENEEGTTGEVIAQRLKSKRLLLIMDDMWECSNKDEWKRFLLPFKKSQEIGEKGNIIMVTTRLPKLAQMVMTTNHPIELGELESGEFKKLFLEFAFANEQYRMDHFLLLGIGDKIIEKLKGSPLAAKTVGRLLSMDLDLGHWTEVLESKEWETQTADNDIMPALRLSYDYLPFRLQQCFLYCGLFPEDYMFTSKELIHFWTGLDILDSSDQNKKALDIIGQSNLNDLVAHGFFRKDEIDGHPRYIMHDLLHDLALKVASHDCLSLHLSNAKSAKILESTRHLSIIVDSAGDIDGVTQEENFKSVVIRLKTRLNVENLQTLMIFGDVDETFGHIFSDLCEKANDLRVLHLPTISCSLESMFHNFSTFLHLRYLLIGTVHNTEMHLPSAISRFYHLRILNLEGWNGSRHFSIHFSNLAKLIHFPTKDNEFHRAISNVGKLQFLQELNEFIINREDSGFELNQLSHLEDLTELGISNLERVQTKETAAEARLREKIHLDKLKLEWGPYNNEPDMQTLVLETLRPHDNLKDLHIKGHRGPSCPAWLGSKLSVKALKSLQLDGVTWENLPYLGKMWVLDDLSLKCIHTFNELSPNHFGPITEQSFCNLKKLALFDMDRLEKWVAGDAPRLFFGLQVLKIGECKELSELPFVNNIHFLPKLEVLDIWRCPKLMSLPPFPWTHTLCEIKIRHVGYLDKLTYKKSSSEVRLHIVGDPDESNVKDMIVISSNLTELQHLVMSEGPRLMLTDLKMLTSLKKLNLRKCEIVSGAVHDSEWQIPIETLDISWCDVSGKVLTQLLCGLTKLRELAIRFCRNITLLDMVAEEQEMPLSSADPYQRIAAEEDDGLLLFPSHLANCLQKLAIGGGENLTLVAPTTLTNGHKRGRNQGGGLQALLCLRELKTYSCPKFLSAYSSSSCCPFPASLQELDLGPDGYISTLELLSNLTSPTILKVGGIELGSKGLWHLLTVGQLSELQIYPSPNFFDIDLFPHEDEQEQLFVSRSSKLHKFTTADIKWFLRAPICRVLSFSLTILHFDDCGDVQVFRKEQEEALHLLTSLQELMFLGCRQLRSLPEGLNKLTSLKTLRINNCPAVGCLPKDGLPGSLQMLDVASCGNGELKELCRQLKLTGTIRKVYA